MNYYNPNSIVIDSFTEYMVDVHYKPKDTGEWISTCKYFDSKDEAKRWRDTWIENIAGTIDGYRASIYQINTKTWG